MDDDKPAETPSVLDQTPPAASPPPSIQTPTSDTNQPAQESNGLVVKPKGSGIKSKLPIISVVVLLLIILAAVGVFFWKNIITSDEPAPTPEETPIVEEVTPEPTPASASTSADFNDFLDNLSNTVKNEDFNAIISLQRIDEIECDPTSEGIVQTICEGESKGTKKSGYWYGPTQGEFSMVPKDQYLTYLKEIFDQNGPYTFFDSKQKGNKAIAIYKGKKLQNSNLDSMIGFYVTNKNSTWQISYFVYGPLTKDFNPISDDHFTFN